MWRHFLNGPELQSGRPDGDFQNTELKRTHKLNSHSTLTCNLLLVERKTLTATQCSPTLLAEWGKATLLPTFLSPSREGLQSNDATWG